MNPIGIKISIIREGERQLTGAGPLAAARWAGVWLSYAEKGGFSRFPQRSKRAKRRATSYTAKAGSYPTRRWGRRPGRRSPAGRRGRR